MNMEIFVPQDANHVLRCWELMQRTNQLNLSARRYSPEAFDRLLHTEGVFCAAFHCADRFGDYGIVGFASVEESRESARLADFVISCRVAQKRIEHAFVKWLADREAMHGRKVLEAELAKTDRNGPLRRVFDELPFAKVRENPEHVLMHLALDEGLQDEGIVHIEARV